MNARKLFSLLVLLSLAATLPGVATARGHDGSAPPGVALDGSQAKGPMGPANPTADPTIPFSPEGQVDVVLVSQPPDHLAGYFSDADCDACGGTQVLADNFFLETDAAIWQVALWGAYYSNDVPIDTDVLTVIFHSDSMGLPGGALYAESPVAHYARAQTGVILFGVHEWMHTLTLATPIYLPAGTYWIEIYNDTIAGTDSTDYLWESGTIDAARGVPGGAVAAEAPGATWYAEGGQELAFRLIGALQGPAAFEMEPPDIHAEGFCGQWQQHLLMVQNHDPWHSINVQFTYSVLVGAGLWDGIQTVVLPPLSAYQFTVQIQPSCDAGDLFIGQVDAVTSMGLSDSLVIFKTLVPPCSTHLFRTKMNWASASRPGWVKTVFGGILDNQDHMRLGGATVEGHWILNGVAQPTQTSVTTPTGQFKFAWKGPWALPGTYAFQVTGVAYDGCDYDVAANENPAYREVTIPQPPN